MVRHTTYKLQYYSCTIIDSLVFIFISCPLGVNLLFIKENIAGSGRREILRQNFPIYSMSFYSLSFNDLFREVGLIIDVLCDLEFVSVYMGQG